MAARSLCWPFCTTTPLCSRARRPWAISDSISCSRNRRRSTASLRPLHVQRPIQLRASSPGHAGGCLRPAHLSQVTVPKAGKARASSALQCYSSFHIQLGEEVEPGAAPRPVTVAVTVEKDQTLLSLAKQTAIPYEKLLAVNRGKRHVKKGQVLHFALEVPENPELYIPEEADSAPVDSTQQQQQQQQQQASSSGDQAAQEQSHADVDSGDTTAAAEASTSTSEVADGTYGGHGAWQSRRQLPAQQGVVPGRFPAVHKALHTGRYLFSFGSKASVGIGLIMVVAVAFIKVMQRSDTHHSEHDRQAEAAAASARFEAGSQTQEAAAEHNTPVPGQLPLQDAASQGTSAGAAPVSASPSTAQHSTTGESHGTGSHEAAGPATASTAAADASEARAAAGHHASGSGRQSYSPSDQAPGGASSVTSDQLASSTVQTDTSGLPSTRSGAGEGGQEPGAQAGAASSTARHGAHDLGPEVEPASSNSGRQAPGPDANGLASSGSEGSGSGGAAGGGEGSELAEGSMLTALAGQDDDDDGLVGEPDWLQLPLVWVITVGQESCLTMDLSAGEDDARCMVVWEDIADANACITCLGEAGSLPADMEVDISGYEPYGALRVAGGGGYQVAFAPEGVLQGLSDLDVEGIHVELLMNASIFPLDYVAALLRQRQQRADAAAKLDAQRARFAAHKRQGSAGAGSAAAARSTVIEADRVILPDYRRQQGNQAPSPAELGSSSSESDSGDEAGSAADQQGAASRNGSQNGSAPSLNGSRSSQPPPPPPVSSPAAPPAASRTQQYASMARKQEQRPRSQGVEELLERTREFPLPSEHLAAEEQRRQRQAQQAQQAELEQDAAAATGSEEGRRGADAARQSRAEQREGAAQKRREAVDSNWWHMLPYICVPTIAGMDGVEGFLVQDLSSDDSGASHILAFQDRDDADRLIWVLQRWCDEQALRMRVAPFSAAQIRERAELQGAQVMVFRKGQLPLKPGMTQEEVANMAFIYSRT